MKPHEFLSCEYAGRQKVSGLFTPRKRRAFCRTLSARIRQRCTINLASCLGVGHFPSQKILKNSTEKNGEGNLSHNASRFASLYSG